MKLNWCTKRDVTREYEKICALTNKLASSKRRGRHNTKNAKKLTKVDH